MLDPSKASKTISPCLETSWIASATRVVALEDVTEMAYRYAKQAILMPTEDFQQTKRGVRKLYEVMNDINNATEVGYLMYERSPERRQALVDGISHLLSNGGMKAHKEELDAGYDSDLSKI